MQLLKALLVVSSVAGACGQATVTVTDAAGFSSALANVDTTQIVVSADLLLDGRAGPMTIGPRRASLEISGDTATGDRALVGNGWRMFTINDEGGGSTNVTFRDLTVRNGGNSGFYVTGSNTEVHFRGVTLANHRGCRGGTNNRCNGGALHAREGATITMEDSVVTNNQVTDHGGGIFTDAGASLTIHRTALSRNTGQNRAGGCLAAYNSRVEITTSNFSESRASWRGAGFVFQNTTGTVTDSNVFGNSVWHHHGAGVSIEYYSRVNLTRVNIHDNINDGGNNWRYAAGINIDMAVVSLFQTNIYNNVLAGSCGDANREACEGGGMYIGGHGGRNRASTVYMEDCNVLNNTASSYAEGGGIFVTNSDLEMVRCNVSGNSAEEEADEGGGIYIEGTAALSLTDTEVSHNLAGVGGGLYATGGVNVQLSNVRMTGNIATENADTNDWIRGSSTIARCSTGQCIFGTQCESCNAPVGPAPAISPTAAPTAPTMAPTAAPTFHPCTDGSHGCDVGTAYCAVRVDVADGYTCECNAGFSRATVTACVITANPTGAPATAGPSTAPTTSAPSVPPTGSPTPAPSLAPTTLAPSVPPTGAPTPAPSLAPTSYPTFSPEEAPTTAPTIDGNNGGARSGAQGSGGKASDNGGTIVIVAVIAVLMVIGTVVTAACYIAHWRRGGNHAAAGFDNPAYASGPSTASMGGHGRGDTGHYSSAAPTTGGGHTGYMDVAPGRPAAAATVGYMDVAPTGGFDDDNAEDV